LGSNGGNDEPHVITQGRTVNKARKKLDEKQDELFEL